MFPNQDWQNTILEDIALHAPLDLTLQKLTLMLEELMPGSRASILLLEGQRLRLAAAPSLSEGYNRAIDGVEIGPSVGSCGSAAYLGEPVLVSDIQSDSRWENFRQLALQEGLRACWSTPILSRGKVLGTFAVYFPQPAEPRGEELPWLQRAQHLACLAVESDRSVAQLRESEKRYRTLVDHAKDGIFLFDSNQVVLDVNQAACESLQYRAAELVGSPISLFNQDLSPRVWQAEGHEFQFESRHRRRDGTSFPVEIRARQFQSHGESRVLALVSDITTRLETESALRRANDIARLTNWVYDVHTQTFQRSSAPPLPLERWRRRIHPDDLDGVLAAWDKTLSEGVAYDRQYRTISRDRIHWVRVWANPTRGVNGQIENISGLTQDITHQRHLEDQLRESQKMEAVGRLAGGIAHDFNNLLTIIRGYTELLNVDMGDPSDQEAMEYIRQASDKAASLTSQLLAFSRQTVVAPQVLDLHPLIQQSVGLISSLLGDNIRVELDFLTQPCIVCIDPTQFEQLLMNLAVNARDAMPQGGVLKITTSRQGTAFRISVADQGVGIDPQVLEHIFEPFFTTKGPGFGTGLGLAVVHGVVARWSGNIQVESVLGKGTTFHLTFPLATATPVAQPKQSDVREFKGSETVLWVEDEPAVRSMARRALEGYGYNVLTCSEPCQAKEVDPHTIDVLLTDVIMPGMSGIELAAALRQRRPDLPILYVTGYADDRLPLENLRPGQEALLHKPFTPNALAHKLRQLLDQG